MAEPIPLRRRDGSVRAFALVDDGDAARVLTFRWSLHAEGYAQRREGQHTVLLHRWLMGLEKGDRREVDHQNRNRLDCRRENMRVVPPGANTQNMLRGTGASRFRGVARGRRGRWQAYVGFAGKRKALGEYATELEAAVVAQAARDAHLPYALPDPELLRALAA